MTSESVKERVGRLASRRVSELASRLRASWRVGAERVATAFFAALRDDRNLAYFLRWGQWSVLMQVAGRRRRSTGLPWTRWLSTISLMSSMETKPYQTASG